MKGIDIKFKNRPNIDGTVSNFTINDCLIAQNGAPGSTNPQVTVHLPKNSTESVEQAWFDYEGYTYHVEGTTISGIAENVPSRWNRYCTARRFSML